MNLIDIGVNLTDKLFAKDMVEVINRAETVGVLQMVVTGAHLYSSQQAADLCRQFPRQLVCTAGFHPHYADQNQPSAWQKLQELWQLPQVRAIGETGLDFNRNLSTPQAQLDSFERHLQAAADTDLPLFLHARDAADEFIELLRHYRHRFNNAVLHCFTGGRQFLDHLLDLDLYIGITGWICDERRGRHLHELVRHIPANRLMLETDAPYLIPRDLHPKPRSGRNEPAFLPHILATVANCREESPQALAMSSQATASKFFGLNRITALTPPPAGQSHAIPNY